MPKPNYGSPTLNFSALTVSARTDSMREPLS
jgi:hypothetical protein